MKLEEIRLLIDSATPGPWSPFQTSHSHEELLDAIAEMLKKGGPTFYFVRCPIAHQDDEETMTVAHVGNGPNGSRNAAFVAKARTLMPPLVQVAEAARDLAKSVLTSLNRNDHLKVADEVLAKLHALESHK